MNAKEWIDSSFDCQNDYVLVTGASSGIGLEYLKAFLALGCRCIATSNDAAELAETCDSLQGKHRGPIIEVVADLSTLNGIQQLLSSIQGYSIGVLVNNAGFGIKGPFVEQNPQLYSDVVVLNSLAPTLISRHCVPQMLSKGRGLVLHVASVNAVTPIGYNAVYTATKAYLLYYAYAMAYELKQSPLMFQIVLPGTTNTPFHRRQGAVPQSMFMSPDLVVSRSLARIDQSVHVSNRFDRLLLPIVSMLPLSLRIRLGTYLLKRRLKII